MKKIIILENYNSKFFPVNAKWNFYGTKSNMEKYHLGLYDAFKDAVQTYGKSIKLRHAWYFDDFREFIHSAYCEEYLDFSKYPLKYKL